MIAGEGAGGDRKTASRKRAEGTREHIVAYLVQTGELADSAGARESLRRLSGPADLDSSELVLLQRLLGPDAGTAGYSAATPG
jgi:hypothetical protein